MRQNILVTGGAGYIGTHTLLQLLLGGYKVDVVDLDNFSDVALQGVRELAGEHGANLSVHKLDLKDRPALQKLFSSKKFDSVLHFAGLKSVGESKATIDGQARVSGTIILLQVMDEHGCTKLVFSSSASVDGCGQKMTNPQTTRHYIEATCRQKYKDYSDWKVILLRYFNPVGAHPNGHIGEDPRGIPKDLIPFVKQVAVGSRPALITVDGIDYSTKDVTGEVRDYIHVIDLADGHIAAVRKLDESDVGCEVYSLGKGTSVLEMVDKEEGHRARMELKAEYRERIKRLLDNYVNKCKMLEEEMEKKLIENPQDSLWAIEVKHTKALTEDTIRIITKGRVELGKRKFENEEEKNDMVDLIIQEAKKAEGTYVNVIPLPKRFLFPEIPSFRPFMEKLSNRWAAVQVLEGGRPGPGP